MADPNPPVLHYARPRPASVGVLDIAASALAFAAGHWVAEYATDYVLIAMTLSAMAAAAPLPLAVAGSV